MLPNEQTLGSTNHKKAADHRGYTPDPVDGKPSILFPGSLTDPYEPYSGLFVNHQDRREALVYIYSCFESTGIAPDRAVYARVWGPKLPLHPAMHNFTTDLEDWAYPQYARRAELRAAIQALRCSAAWKIEGFDKLVVAFSGDYILDKVVRVNLRDEVEKDKKGEPAEYLWRHADDLDLRSDLEDQLEKMNNERVTVRFWQIDAAENMAKEFAENRLHPKESAEDLLHPKEFSVNKIFRKMFKH